MTLSSASRQRLGKLGLLALLCALPFVLSIVYLTGQVERIDTLPVDEYKDLTWTPDGQSLLFLHRSLEAGAPTDLWSRDSSGGFESMASLSSGSHWQLTPHFVDEALTLVSTQDELQRVALFSGEQPQFLDLPDTWTRLPSQGEGLFFAQVVDDVPFEEMAQVEEAPEVASASRKDEEPDSTATPAAPLRSGLQVARYNLQSGGTDLILTIPFDSPEEKPEILLVRESPDQRFLALVTRFGDSNAAGLWVYDSQGSRLLWTRVITDTSARGLDWSSSSVALALCDAQGVVILDNVLYIESTRYEAQGLGAVAPLFLRDDSLYLVGERAVHRLDRQAGQIDMVYDSASHSSEVQEFVVSPSGTKAAFFSTQHGYLELAICSLDEPGAEAVVAELPGSLRRKAQGTLTYQVGDAVRTAWRYWRTL